MKTFKSIFFTRQGFHTDSYEVQAETLKQARKEGINALLKEKAMFAKEDEGDDFTDEDAKKEAIKRIIDGEYIHVATFELVGETNEGFDDLERSDFKGMKI